MPASSPLILVTGGSGFIGFAVVQNALIAGYRVRAAIRRQDAEQAIANAPGMKTYTSSGALTFVTVLDNTVEGAYLEAVQDCEYIIHLASPIAIAPVSLSDASSDASLRLISDYDTTPHSVATRSHTEHSY
jgi:nucleoside-diphosphate-sugar epimerase